MEWNDKTCRFTARRAKASQRISSGHRELRRGASGRRPAQRRDVRAAGRHYMTGSASKSWRLDSLGSGQATASAWQMGKIEPADTGGMRDGEQACGCVRQETHGGAEGRATAAAAFGGRGGASRAQWGHSAGRGQRASAGRLNVATMQYVSQAHV